MKLIAKTLGLASIFLAYAKFENPEYIEFRYGLLTTVLLLMLIGTPLMNLVSTDLITRLDIYFYYFVFYIIFYFCFVGSSHKDQEH